MSELSPADVTVDEVGIGFRPGFDDPVDVAFDHVLVCSLSPGGNGQGHLVPWPRLLRPFLDGRTRVTVTVHRTGEVLFDAERRFGAGGGRVRVVDARGRPLAVDKWGSLARSFAMSGPQDVAVVAAAVQRLLRDLNDIVGVPAFLAYGSLLGAVREGKVIGHDFDADISYLSRFSHPADISRERMRVQRRLRDLGWTVHSQRASVLQVGISGTDEDRHIDVFVAYFHEATFNIDRWVEGPLRRDQIVPLTTINLEGRPCPAPADPEALLVLTYGPGWRVPDPSFGFRLDRAHRRRMMGWWGREGFGRAAWTTSYRHSLPPAAPSEFCRWVLPRLRPGVHVVELGCGQGVDTIALVAATGRGTGWDIAPTAIRQARIRAQATRSPARFDVVNLGSLRETVANLARVSAEHGQQAVVGRFVLDALVPSARANAWLVAKALLRGGGAAYLEFRAEPGQPLPEIREPKWAPYVDVDRTIGAIHATGGVVVAEERVPGGPANRPGGATVILPATHRVVVRWR